MSIITRRNFLIGGAFTAASSCIPKVEVLNLRNGYIRKYSPSRGSSRLFGYKVALTVGHGYFEGGSFDSGAVAGKITEFELNLIQSHNIATILSQNGATVNVYVYKEKHHGASLEQRGLNASGHDLHISLHHNKYQDQSIQGGEVLICGSAYTDEDKILAGAISDEMSKATGLKNRGVKPQSLGVLKSTPSNVVKCLTEPLFISDRSLSTNDILILSDAASKGIASGVEKYLINIPSASEPSSLGLANMELNQSTASPSSRKALAESIVLADQDIDDLYKGH